MDENQSSVNRKLDAILTALSIINQSINHLSNQIGGTVSDSVAKLKASSDQLQAAIDAATKGE
jgi:hypothetical protein